MDKADGWPHRPLHIYFPVPASLGRLIAKVKKGEEVKITYLGRSDKPASAPRFFLEVRR